MILVVVLLVIAALVAGFAAGVELPVGRTAGRRRRARAARVAAAPDNVGRILLPFTGSAISRRAFDAAVRLARVEGATLMPCYLATVPLNLPLDAPLPHQCLGAMTLLEVIEQRAATQEVVIDARISRSRRAAPRAGGGALRPRDRLGDEPPRLRLLRRRSRLAAEPRRRRGPDLAPGTRGCSRGVG
jgi:hypothetical protein